MEQLLLVSSQFPTLIFSVLLGIVIVYWLIGMLGAIDLDLAGDSDIDLDADGDINVGGMAGLFLTFGLTGVPLTLVLSIIVLFCWLISVYAQYYLLSWLPTGWLYYPLGLLSSVVIFFITLPITAIVIRPLKKLFKHTSAANSQSLVGKDAIIATGSVSETFGQARVFNDGAELLLDVRCDQAHTLTQGDKVLVIEYNPEKHHYIVAPMPQTL